VVADAQPWIRKMRDLPEIHEQDAAIDKELGGFPDIYEMMRLMALVCGH